MGASNFARNIGIYLNDLAKPEQLLAFLCRHTDRVLAGWHSYTRQLTIAMDGDTEESVEEERCLSKWFPDRRGMVTAVIFSTK
jgi:hypothetical protein